MTKTLNTTIAAALLATSVFGASAAFAGGDYYQGAWPQPVQTKSEKIDRVTTQSIGKDSVKLAPTSANPGAANGDYYQGAYKQR